MILGFRVSYAPRSINNGTFPRRLKYIAMRQQQYDLGIKITDKIVKSRKPKERNFKCFPPSEF